MKTTYPCHRCNTGEGSPVCLQDERCPIPRIGAPAQTSYVTDSVGRRYEVRSYTAAQVRDAVAAERERWRSAAAEALGWMDSAWHRIDGEWGPSGKTLDQACADGEEPEIAALRALLVA